MTVRRCSQRYSHLGRSLNTKLRGAPSSRDREKCRLHTMVRRCSQRYSHSGRSLKAKLRGVLSRRGWGLRPLRMNRRPLGMNCRLRTANRVRRLPRALPRTQSARPQPHCSRPDRRRRPCLDSKPILPLQSEATRPRPRGPLRVLIAVRRLAEVHRRGGE